MPPPPTHPETNTLNLPPPAQVPTSIPQDLQDPNKEEESPATTPRSSEEEKKTVYTLEGRISPDVSNFTCHLASNSCHMEDFHYLTTDCLQFPIFSQTQNILETSYLEDVQALWNDCISNPNFLPKSDRPVSAMSNSSSLSIDLLTGCTNAVNNSIDMFASYDNIQNTTAPVSSINEPQNQMNLPQYNSHENSITHRSQNFSPADSNVSIPQNQMGLLHFDSPVNDASFDNDEDSGHFSMSQQNRAIFHCSCIFEEMSSRCCYCGTSVFTDPYLSPCYGNIDNAFGSCAFNTELSFLEDIFV